MSIIHNALKKAQGNLKKNEDKEKNKLATVYARLHPDKSSSGKPPPPPQPPKKRSETASEDSKEKSDSQRSAKPIIIAVIAVVIFVTIFSLVLFLPATRNSAFSRKVKSLGAMANRPRYKKGEIILNGIMLMGDKRVALINNQIYESGETINGKKILSISMNQVELQHNNKTEILKVR